MSLKRKTPLRPKKNTTAKVLDPDVINRLLGEGKLQKGSTFKAKPKPMRKRAERKGPAQMDVFRQIWAERPHVSEVSGEPLGDVLQPIFFSHLLPKGAYRKYKLDPRNIVLKTPDEHREWHEQGPRNLIFVRGWAEICDRYFDLMREANGVQE